MKLTLLPIPFVCALFFHLPVRAQEPSGIDERAKGEWIHRDSKTIFRTPPGWMVITPQRLRRDSTTTVMGIERLNDSRIIVNATFSPLDSRKFSESISDVADKNGDFGEEHAMLVAIYGKERVGKPVVQTIGNYTVHKIRIESGPIPEDQSVGMLYLFETGLSDKKWKVKVRANFPKLNESSYTDLMNGILAGFAQDGR